MDSACKIGLETMLIHYFGRYCSFNHHANRASLVCFLPPQSRWARLGAAGPTQKGQLDLRRGGKLRYLSLEKCGLFIILPFTIGFRYWKARIPTYNQLFDICSFPQLLVLFVRVKVCSFNAAEIADGRRDNIFIWRCWCVQKVWLAYGLMG